MTVVDGGSGSIVWSYSIPCHMKETPTTSAITSDQKSVFLFWAEALTAASLSSVSDGEEGVGGGNGGGWAASRLSHTAIAAALWSVRRKRERELGGGGQRRPKLRGRWESWVRKQP